MTFDISTIEVSDTFDVPVLNPRNGQPFDGEGGKPMSVTVYGPATLQFAAAQSAQSNRNLTRVRNANGDLTTSPEEDIEERALFLADITKSLNNFTYGEGAPTDRETILAMYRDLKMGFIAQAVNAKAGNWGNFTKAAPGS